MSSLVKSLDARAIESSPLIAMTNENEAGLEKNHHVGKAFEDITGPLQKVEKSEETP